MSDDLPLTPDFGIDYLTREHYAAFGMVTHLASALDALLDQIIVAMTKSAFEPAFYPLLTFLSAKDKRDYINAMVKISAWPPEVVKSLNKLMDRTKSAFELRNAIAHCVWKKGRRKDTIKPISLSARGVMKFLGSGHNEREWTAPELIVEAAKIHQIGIDLKEFMRLYGLLSPTYPEKPSSRPVPTRSR